MFNFKVAAETPNKANCVAKNAVEEVWGWRRGTDSYFIQSPNHQMSIEYFQENRIMQMKGKEKDQVKWDKVFKNGPSKICGRQPLRNFTWPILKYFVPNILRQHFQFYLKSCHLNSSGIKNKLPRSYFSRMFPTLKGLEFLKLFESSFFGNQSGIAALR